jgi:hypothetical protein
MLAAVSDSATMCQCPRGRTDLSRTSLPGFRPGCMAGMNCHARALNWIFPCPHPARLER